VSTVLYPITLNNDISYHSISWKLLTLPTKGQWRRLLVEPDHHIRPNSKYDSSHLYASFMKIELLLYFLAARTSNVTTEKKNSAEEVCVGRIRRRDLQGAGEQGKFHYRRGQI
jgi:hypothetical protein